MQVCTCDCVSLFSHYNLPCVTGTQTFYSVARCYVGDGECPDGGLKDKTTTISLLVILCVLWDTKYCVFPSGNSLCTVGY